MTAEAATRPRVSRSQVLRGGRSRGRVGASSPSPALSDLASVTLTPVLV